MQIQYTQPPSVLVENNCIVHPFVNRIVGAIQLLCRVRVWKEGTSQGELLLELEANGHAAAHNV
jgi:hypothetical protein